MKRAFPRTEVAGVSLPRLLIGTNWFLGFSHRSQAADAMIRERFSAPEDFWPILEEYLDNGVDAIMGPFDQYPVLGAAVRYAEDRAGQKIHIIDTPIINVGDSAEARREAEAAIQRSAAGGAEFCLLHHSCAEQLVNKNLGVIARLPDYTKMIREAGMIPGLSAHMPEMVVYSDRNGYDVETYIQIYNCAGFLMQVEIEYIARVIHEARKPVMTIKPFAAGRVTPYVGLNFSLATLRPCDMVTVGVTSRREAAEDIEIAFAALERRFPDLEGRTSPAVSQDAFGGKK